MADELKVRLTAEGIKEIMDGLRKVQTEVKKTTEASSGADKALGALGVLFAGQQLAAFTARAIDAADAIHDMSQKTGVATESLSVFLAMGRQAGTDTESLQGGFTKLAKSMDALQRGEGEATAAFARIGLGAEDLAGLSLDQAMVRIADAMGQFKDGAGKAAVATQIFGKAGANLLPLLHDLADGGFDKNREKLEKLGAVLSKDAADAADAFNDALADLNTTAQAATVQVAGAFLPALTKAASQLAQFLAETPQGAKTFGVSMVLVGSTATAAAVAVRALGAAFAGLGPIGLAVVALSALTAGLVALSAAQEQARADEMKAIEQKGKFVQQSESLEAQYRREAEALARSGSNQREAAKHKAALKKISDQLVALAPDLKRALDDETISWEKKAEAIKKAREEKEKELSLDLQKAKEELRSAEASLAKEQEFYDLKRQEAELEAKQVGGPAVVDSSAQFGLKRAQAQVDAAKKRVEAIEISAGLRKAEPGSGQGGKDIATQNKDLLKAQIAGAVAAAKQQEALGKQALDELMAYTEDAYAQGVIRLERYTEDRKNILQAGLANEINSLQTQIDAERAALSIEGGTPAEKLAVKTRLGELESQIQLKVNEARAKGFEIDRKVRDEREAGGLEALKLEAELEQAKGLTGAAALRAIAAEYDQRIQLAKNEDQREQLRLLKVQALAKARLQANQQRGENLFGSLQGQLDQVALQRQAGTLSEEGAVQKRIAIYQQFLPLLKEVTAEQLRLAQATGDQQAILQAEGQDRKVQEVGLELSSLQDDLKGVKEAGRQALEEGLGDFLANIGDKVRDLQGAFRALGTAIAKAIAQAAANRLAMGLVNAVLGPAPTAPGHADGGLITGPGTGTSDSILARLSNKEYVIRAAAVERYGVGFMDAINGMRFPSGTFPRFAEGGLAGGSVGRASGPSTLRVINVVDPSLVMNVLQGRPFEQAVMNVIGSNSNELRMVLG